MDGVISFPCGQAVGSCSAAKHHMLNTAITNGAIGKAREKR